MKKNIVALVMVCSSAVAALGMSAPAQAQLSRNTIGPVLSIGGGQTVIGVDSKFGVSDNLSLRPFIFFPSGGTTFGSGLTYDFNLANSGSKVQITPFIGGYVAINSGAGSSTNVGFLGGADFDVTEAIQLRAALNVPVSSNNSVTTILLGAGYKF